MTAHSADVIRRGLDRAQWNLTDLWIASVGIGGGFTRDQIAHITDGTTDATSLEHDILATALNDHFTDHGQNHPVQYWDQLTQP